MPNRLESLPNDEFENKENKKGNVVRDWPPSLGCSWGTSAKARDLLRVS
jgi:hypothetical protein